MSDTSLQLPDQAAMDLPPMATNSIPSPHPTSAMTLADDSGPFLRLPREIRDCIYRYLLSTKYTKRYEGEVKIDSLRRRYSYQFHTAIFYTSRQVYNEASNVFYMENLFIRANLGNTGYTASHFRDYQTYFRPGYPVPFAPRRYQLPILSCSTQVLACKCHVMELRVRSMYQSDRLDQDCPILFACDDLPTFSRLLVELAKHGVSLPLLELSIIIGDEVGTVGGQSHGLNTRTIGNPKELLTAAIKNAAANHILADETPGVEDESKLLSGQNKRRLAINRIKAAKSGCSQRPTYVDNRRVQSLLEPMRLLYNVGNLYVDAPISAEYWLEIFTTLSSPQPSVHVRFAAVYTALSEAVEIFDAGDMAFAILKLKGLMDTVNEFMDLCEAEDCSTVLVTGQYTGLTYKVAYAQMQCLVWNKLARASLSLSEDPQQVRTAWKLTKRSIQECRCYHLGCKNAEFGHDNVCTLITMVLEALDQLGEYNNVPRSHALRKVIKALDEAVRERPGNALLEGELQRRLKEKQEAEMVEDARKTESDEDKVMSGHLTK